MQQYKLSMLVPARNEEFLARTVQDLLENTSDQTEILVGLDGSWALPPVDDHPRVNIVYVPKSIGQRAMTNLLCRLSNAKYVAKVDAHTAYDKDWDLKMFEALEKTGDNVTMVSTMKNLMVFDWVCECGFRHYQDKGQKCPQCGKPMKKEIIWKTRRGSHNFSYCFDPTPHFQYMPEMKERPGGRESLTETMSLQGSCFMMTREKYWELNICDEALGSWGSQGIEVACKTWLSGGKVMCYHDTWYAHMFRTKPENSFGFPYKQDAKQIQDAKLAVKDLFFKNKWDKQIHNLSWLVERFSPVPGWTDEDLLEIKKYDRIETANKRTQ